MTWNIHKGIGGVDRRYDMLRVLTVLEHYAPDLVMLQEVAQGMPVTKQHDQVQMLADTLGMHHAFHPEHQFRRGGYGNLILSRWPLDDVAHVDLKVGWRKQRGLIQARTHVRFDGHQRSVVIINMHLGLAGSERGEQLQRFLACHPLAGVAQRTPVILGGDFNDLWGSLGPRFLVPAGFTRVGGVHNSFPAAMPLRPLDALFLRGDVRSVRSDVGRTSVSRAASDHLPLYADLELPL